MKNKRSPVGQYIIEGLGESDDSYEYVYELLPLIGEVVLFFNALESDLDHHICFYMSDRSDQKGLLVLTNMMYATKVDLFYRFYSEYLRGMNFQIECFDGLISDLKECGTLRNRIVHANWLQTDEEGYTQVRIKHSKNGLEHELWQFSIESIEKVLEKIHSTRSLLDYFWQSCEDEVMRWNKEIEDRKNKDA